MQMHDINRANMLVGERARALVIGAALWAFTFAAINLYWALGGRLGVETLGEGMADMVQTDDPLLFQLNWVSVIGKAVLGVMALALLRPWSNTLVRRLLVIGTWSAGILLTLYGAGNAIQHALMLAGVLPVASLLGSASGVLWHLLVWDPVWLVGGILFLLIAQQFKSAKSNQK